MITNTIARLTHMACSCGRVPQLVLCRTHGGVRYRVEAVCCKIVSAMFRTEIAATNEFQRILAALYADAHADPSAVPQPTFAVQVVRSVQ